MAKHQKKELKNNIKTMKRLLILFLLSFGIANAQKNATALGTTILGTYRFDAKNEKPTATVFQENGTGLIFYKADFDLEDV